MASRIGPTTVALLGLGWSCGGSSGTTNRPDAGQQDVAPVHDGSVEDATVLDGSPLTQAHACSDLFSQDLVRTYEVEISASEWAKLQNEFVSMEPDPDGAGYESAYHPIVFHMEGETRTDAMMRLKGDSSWLETITWDKKNPKAQFVIAFDEANASSPPFHGVNKLGFDMPRTDPTYLRERVGHAVMREMGEAGLCVASARLIINGDYYGLYAAEERLGRRALKRIYPEAPDGDLWKSGTKLETNNASPNWQHQQAFWAAKDVPSMLKIIDLSQAVHEWAVEIVINDSDGYYGGDHNFYIYDYPKKGFYWVPTDLDSTFDYLPYNMNPIYWWEDHDTNQTAGQHFRAVLNDPTWRRKLADAVGDVLARWDVSRIQGMIDAWASQVADAVEQDPHRWVTMDQHRQAVAAMRDTVQQRAEYLKTWLACEQTGSGTDADGDGAAWCFDCNDQNDSIHPGASEICGNDVDDDCNGLKDDGC